MVDPASAITIASLAFAQFFQTEAGKKLIESSVGKLGEKLTEGTLKQMNELRQMIWNRLRGNPKAEQALTEAEQGTETALESVTDYLKIAMREDQEFAAQIQAIAHEIHINTLQDNSSQVQNQTVQSGGVGYQTQMGNKNTNFIGGTHTHVHDTGS